MIATTRGLFALAVLAVLLAVVAVVGRSRPVAALDRTLGLADVPVMSFDVRRTDEPAVTVVGATSHDVAGSGSHDGAWHITAPERATADPATVDALVTALRAARWHRRAAPEVAGPVRHVLEVHPIVPSVRIALGNELAGADQSWLVVGDHALLVDGWVARALFPTRLALTIVQPFSALGPDARIRDDRIDVAGSRLVKPRALWIDPARIAVLDAALANVAIVGFTDMHPGESGRHIAVISSSVEATAVGTCQADRVLVRFSTGTGCVQREAWQRALDALDGLATLPAEQLADARIVPVVAERIDIGGTTVALTGMPRVGTEDADPERIGELVGALATRGEVTSRMPTGAPRATIGVTGQGTTVHLRLFDKAIVRDDEPVAIGVPASVIAILARPASALRDPVLWREEVTTLSSIEVDGVAYRRGAVVGEWTGGGDPALLDALASTLATVRAPAARAPAHIAHTIRVTFTPPAGAATTHVLAIGAPTATGCPGKADGVGVTLDLALCTAGMAVAGQTHAR